MQVEQFLLRTALKDKFSNLDIIVLLSFRATCNILFSNLYLDLKLILIINKSTIFKISDVIIKISDIVGSLKKKS